ncbi:beta-lactamase family protein [Bacillus spizizenii]|uniref:Penicillin-binding endopeptidase X n=2 Tax=Bacillus spizizenii TaxID=96241 RepID=E0TV18_BACSH|nr:serine hydrolase domain-containing protein [Bacillus spizizenii]QCJ17000.1 beta-lactamase family protein [Bacillus subtilis]ADM37789.1 penicillin-binding endopeptidase X [Bacillus spizizenii str. W23]AJW87144.1 penicillin-binding protein [Bacillus spizizenii]EFG92787.1 penicillin-binding endopeptidase X [Bacillus spizizenii ATCC 6633 = JCM 2499]KFK79831.1 beta-lactamase family protein [Bacillus spizizenii]
MTSPTRRRTAKRRRRKLNKRGKLLLGLLAVMICFTIWNALHRNSEENEPSQETAAVSDNGQKKEVKKKTAKKTEEQIKTVDRNQKISNYLKEIGFSGTAMIVRNGEIVTNKGFGYADRKHHIQNNPLTSFYVGSSQKALIATAILQLEEKGKLQTSDPVSAYLPNFPNGQTITLKNLLTHTSGINGHIEGNGAITPDDLIKDVEHQGIKRQPGVWDYKDSNYSVLAYIVAEVSGESYEQYITNHIFKPAGMTHAGFYKTYNKEPYPAVGYKLKGSRMVTPYMPDLSQLYGAGDIYMSAIDMYKFDQALIDGKLYSQKSYEKMFTPGSSSTYGMGFYVAPGSYSNHGVMPGFNILNSFSKSGQTIVVLLSNIQNNAKLGQVNNKIYQLLNQE